MSDTLTLDMRVAAHDQASPIIRKILAEVRKLQDAMKRLAAPSIGKGLDTGTASIRQAANTQRQENARTQASAMRDLRQRFTFERRAERQRTREANEARRADAASEADALKALKSRLTFSSRMARQRLAEERAVSREAAQGERDRLAAVRDQIRARARHDREITRDRSTFVRRARDAGSRTSEAVTRSTRMAAGAGAAGAAATGALVKRSLGAEVDVDAAEIATRQYGGLSKTAARDLRDRWAAPLSEEMGVATAKLLSAWTDAVKLGIPTAGAKDFAGLTTKTSEAWEVEFDEVKDILGTVNTILTSDGSAFDIKRLSSVANTLQHLAAKQSTTPEKLISFLERGAGAAQVLGMSQEAGLAFGSASTSLGNQAGESGRLFDYVASRMIEMPRLVKKHGDEGKQAQQLVRALGYGSAASMDAQRRADPDAFMPDFMERFSKISDPRVQEKAVRFFAGREWMGEFGRMVKGFQTYKEANNLTKEAKGLDAIGAVWGLHKEKLGFVAKQFRAGWLNILGEVGKTLSPLARQAGDYFLGWSRQLRAGGLADRVKATIEGFVNGLGFRDLPDLLRGVLGEPGKSDAGSIQAWDDAARGFGAGIRSIGSAISSAFSIVTGPNASPAAIGKLTGQILALAVACVAVAPIVGVLGSIGTALLAVSLAASSALRVLGGLGLAGVAGRVAGSLGGAGAFLGRLFSLGLVAEIAAHRGEIVTWMLSGFRTVIEAIKEASLAGWDELLMWTRKNLGLKSVLRSILEEMIPAPLRRWMDSGDKGISGGGKPTEQLNPGDELPGLGEAIRDNTKSLKGFSDRIEGTIGTDGLKGNAAEDRIAERIHRLAYRSGYGRLGLMALATRGADYASGGMSSGSVGGGSSGATAPGSPGSPTIGKGDGTLNGLRLPGVASGNGSRSWRNNNPGNLEYGPFAKSMGATGSDGRFAVFPDYATGRKAQEKLLFESGGYRNLTLSQAIRRWAPASENNVPAYIAATGGDPGKRMSEYTPEERGKLLDAMQRHEGWRPGIRAGGGGQVTMPGGNPADVASKFLGFGEHNGGRGALERFTGGNIAGAANAWCARFVNASLAAVGQRGTGSAVANSFLRWGREISAEMVQKGDVLVEHRGRGANNPGGHVGMATGETRMRNGQLEIEMLAGNNSDAVGTTWERASRLSVRRSEQTPPTPDILAEPMRDEAKARGEAHRALVSAGGAGGAGGKSVTVHAPVTITGAPNPEATANRAAKHIQDSTNWTTFDRDFGSSLG